jgi:hypothetical protein
VASLGQYKLEMRSVVSPSSEGHRPHCDDLLVADVLQDVSRPDFTGRIRHIEKGTLGENYVDSKSRGAAVLSCEKESNVVWQSFSDEAAGGGATTQYDATQYDANSITIKKTFRKWL